MENKIVKVDIVDNDDIGVLSTYYLVNPNKDKLEEFKRKIEGRFDVFSDVNASDEEITKAENFCDNIWGEIADFIAANFTTIEVENFEIEY